MGETTRKSFWVCLHGATPRDRRNQVRYTLLLFAWAVCFLGSTFLIRFDLVSAGPMGWAVAMVPSVVAVFVVLAYGRFLREADELQRTIHLQALALAVGAGFIVWPLFKLIDRLGVQVDDWPTIPVLIMIASYAIGTVLGWMRYR